MRGVNGGRSSIGRAPGCGPGGCRFQVRSSTPIYFILVLWLTKVKLFLNNEKKVVKRNKQVATTLNMSVAKYREVESGELGLTLRQIKTLARLFEIDYYDFLDVLEIRYVKKGLKKNGAGCFVHYQQERKQTAFWRNCTPQTPVLY